VARAQEPLPVKSAKLAGKTYAVSGRRALKKGVRLTLGPGVKIVGLGENGTLGVDGGSLEVAGEREAPVVFENVWVSLGWNFQRLRIAHARFEGTGGVVVPHEEETRGKAFLENVAFSGDASVWVTFHEGGIELRNVTAQSACQIAATAPDRNVSLDITGCRFLMKGDPGVIQGGLTVFRVREARVVNTQVDGISASFTGVAKLAIEGCRFDAQGFHVRQDKKDRIGKTQIARCDFASKVIQFEGPSGDRGRVTLKECHFRGDATTEPEEIVRKRITAKDVQVVVKSPKPTPNDLAGPDDSK